MFYGSSCFGFLSLNSCSMVRYISVENLWQHILVLSLNILKIFLFVYQQHRTNKNIVQYCLTFSLFIYSHSFSKIISYILMFRRISFVRVKLFTSYYVLILFNANLSLISLINLISTFFNEKIKFEIYLDFILLAESVRE